MFKVSVKTEFKEAYALIRRAQNLRPPLNRCVAIGVIEFQENIRVGGRPPFRPLKLATIIGWVGGPGSPQRKTWFTKTGKLTKAAARKVATRRPLWDTGALEKSIRPGPILSNTSALVVAGGGDVPYAAIHQFGGFTGRNKAVYVPARPYMLLRPETRERMGQVISTYILTGRVGG